MTKTESPVRIGLLAPFEGRYREIGYDALYAARLAIRDSGRGDVTLLAVDDGGSVETAIQRARALADDELVKVVIVLGYDAADSAVQNALDSLPVLIVGNWYSTATSENTFILSNPRIPDYLTVSSRVEITEAAHLEPPLTGGDVFALSNFSKLRDDTSDISIISSGSLPDENFHERYLTSDLFVDDPGLLATLTYDAVGVAIATIARRETTRHDVVQLLNTLTYEGINGLISFEAGYWVKAPLNLFEYTSSGQLIQSDDVIEER